MPQPLFRLGDHGPAVAQVRDHLARLGLLIGEPAQRLDDASLDAQFDPAVEQAVRAFQQQRGLNADGIVGVETWRRLDDARWRLGDRVLRLVSRRMVTGDDVVALQRRLLELGFDPGRVDGVFGPDTDHALRDLQRNLGIPLDGLCGPVTFKALDRLARTVTGGEPHALREAERLRRSGPGLAGKVVVIDPGHGGADPGVRAHGMTEAEVTSDLAARIEGRLAAVGVVAVLTHGRLPDSADPIADGPRAHLANEVDADLVLSLHCDGSANAHAQGVATFFYGAGRHGVHSVVGEAFADLLQDEVVARTDLLDGRVDGKTWELLRGTRMPAVRLELGYLTHPGDAARLADAAFRDAVAEAVLVALQRLYLPGQVDLTTADIGVTGLTEPVG